MDVGQKNIVRATRMKVIDVRLNNSDTFGLMLFPPVIMPEDLRITLNANGSEPQIRKLPAVKASIATQIRHPTSARRTDQGLDELVPALFVCVIRPPLRHLNALHIGFLIPLPRWHYSHDGMEASPVWQRITLLLGHPATGEVLPMPDVEIGHYS